MRDKKLLKILKKTFGYDSFRLRQKEIIDSILDGRDTLAIMPTGGGKSLCYQIPALYSEGVTLVISPLISLMQDQVMNLEEYDVPAVYLNSSLSFKEFIATKDRIRAGEIKMIYLSPEGILSPSMLTFLNEIDISLIAIDEAHCVSQWGHEFRRDYTRLGELREYFKDVPTLALTATADERTRADIAKQLRLNDPALFLSSFDRPNIRYMILERKDELSQLEEFIRTNHEGETGIVYCLSRAKVERVAEALEERGLPALAYHAGMSPAERLRVSERFNKESHLIVVATIAFGMGIDRPDVRFVAHLDLPKSIESYYQETGRAGRDGSASNAWMMYGLQDVVKLSQMLENTDASEGYKKVARGKLDSMLGLCESAKCRRQYLLGYFGEDLHEDCGNCDSCLEPPVLWDATVDAQKLLSTIYRTGQTFGPTHVIDVLRGSKSNKVTEKGHQDLSVYGIGKDRPKEHWNSILRQLMSLDYIFVKNWEYRSLALSEKARDILTGKIKLELRRRENMSGEKLAREKKSVVSEMHQHPELFDRLRTLRSEIAKEKSVPPYVVFSDKSLHDMCALLPRNDDEFLLVHGVGQSKLQNYGKEFISEIRSFI